MDKLNKIISVFIKQDTDLINNNTIIDKRTIQGSILIHRMYAELAEKGYRVENYEDIATVGQLINKLNNNDKRNDNIHYEDREVFMSNNNETVNLGIDIEKVSNFIEVVDYREDEFYKQNFSQTEIAYCIMQKNPLESFAGKFAAKEALVKCNNSFRKIPFNSIEVLNDINGKPIFEGYSISISHIDTLTVAVAIQNKVPDNNIKQNNETEDKPSILPIVLSSLALIIATLTFVWVLLKL